MRPIARRILGWDGLAAPGRSASSGPAWCLDQRSGNTFAPRPPIRWALTLFLTNFPLRSSYYLNTIKPAKVTAKRGNLTNFREKECCKALAISGRWRFPPTQPWLQAALRPFRTRRHGGTEPPSGGPVGCFSAGNRGTNGAGRGYLTSSIRSSANRLHSEVSWSTSTTFTGLPSSRFSRLQHRCARSIRYMVAHIQMTGLRKWIS